MNIGVLIRIIFKKRSNIVKFFIIYTLILSFFSIQIMVLGKSLNKTNQPDVSISGGLPQEEVYYYKLYNNIDGLDEFLTKELGNDATIYKATVRNVLTVNSGASTDKIAYNIYGVSYDFIENILNNNLKLGTLPKRGENTIILGSYAAQYFKVNVGDILDIPITLNDSIDMNQEKRYTVSGILKDDNEYFKGSIFVENSDFTNFKENSNLIYFKNNSGIEKFKNIIEEDNIFKLYDLSKIEQLYINNIKGRTQVIVNTIITIISTSMIVYLLIKLTLKGSLKDIAILKSLGISNRTISLFLSRTIGILLAISTTISLAIVFFVKNYLNNRYSNFLGYKSSFYVINYKLILFQLMLSVFIYVWIYFIILKKNREISPLEAMIKLD